MARDALATQDPTEVVEVGLTDEQRELLRRGLPEWGGPARLTTALAEAMGFNSIDGFSPSRSACAAASTAASP